MRYKLPKNRLWFNIFIRITVIFLAFVIVLTISNMAFLVSFFENRQKNGLKEQVIAVSELDLSEPQVVINALSDINEKHNFDVEIYNAQGLIKYTTHGGQMMDFFHQNNDRFSMSHEEMKVIKSEKLNQDVVFEKVISSFDKNEYLLCRKQINSNLYAEVRIQKQLIANSAAIANEFIVIISAICFVLSMAWVFIFARKFSRPITEMNEITKDMARLNFDRRLEIDSCDEIGQLADSVNELSSSLSAALNDLKATNARLENEIELERKLDVMRRGFVANVSHELKTPLSIISGYAEGLKMDINPKEKEDYCNTIIEESERMNRLVLSILELSRYESGQIPLALQKFDIGQLTKDMLEKVFRNKNIIFENKIPQGTLCYADFLQIEQVLKSLLENAAAHTPDGGSVITEVKQNEGKLRISVINSGEPIKSDIMPQIWQSFFRGDASHKRDSNRFGLGLSIVAAVMKMHGNSCGVYNMPEGEGVCFWFELSLPEV